MEIISFYKSSSKLFLSDENAFNEIKDNLNIKDAIYSFTILNIITSMLIGIITYSNSNSIEPLYWLVTKTIIGMTTVNLLSLVIVIGILHGIMTLFKPKETYSSSLKFAISSYIIPTIIISLMNLIIIFIYKETETLSFNAKDIIIISLFAIIFIATTIWQLAIMAKSFSKIHEITMGKVITSYLILVVLGFILLGTVISLLFFLIQSLNI